MVHPRSYRNAGRNIRRDAARLVAIVLLASAPPAWTAECTLVVPPCQGTVQLATPLPESVDWDGTWQWREAGGKGEIPTQLIPQLTPDGGAGKLSRVAAIIPPKEGTTGPRQFHLSRAQNAVPAQIRFQFKELDGNSLGLFDGDKPVLVYNHGVITNERVPKNDLRRSRGCFIHPVYGLSGEVLTESFPKDHYHHHGIFWAWPHVRIDGKEYDLWTYGNIQPRFVRWLARRVGPVAAVLGVENGWYVGQKKVVTERVWLRVYSEADDARAVDLEFAFVPEEKSLTLWGAPGKSYGGLNLRFAPRQETRITTPSGLTKDDLPDTPLAWADLTARFAGASGPSGAAVFVSPTHPDFPPTWLTRHYGILCVGWPGVKPKTFAPGEPIRLDYRVWIHKSAVAPEGLRGAFAEYSATVGLVAK